MPLHCHASVAPARTYADAAAAALHSLKLKQAPALPDPQTPQTPPHCPQPKESAVPAAAADSTSPSWADLSLLLDSAASSTLFTVAEAADDEAAAECDETAALSDDADEPCDEEWRVDEEEEETDEADDYAMSEWERVESLATAALRASDSAINRSQRRSRRRAPPHSRISTSALQSASRHSGALSISGSAKSAPLVMSRWRSGEAEPSQQRQAPPQPVIEVTKGVLQSPFAAQEERERQVELANMRRALRKEQDQQLGSHHAVAACDDEQTAPSAPDSAKQRKGEMRAAITAARKLPLHLHRCDNPKWAAVLQARAATKQLTAERRSQVSRRPQMAKQAQQPSTVNDAARKVVRMEAAAQAHKQRREQRAIKQQLRLKLRRELQANQLSPVQPLTSTFTVGLAVARWTAAHTLPSDSETSDSETYSETSASSPSTSATKHSHSLSSPHSATSSASAARLRMSPFEQFRRSWYYTHRAHLESALPGAVVSIRLANPAPAVQSVFMSLMRGRAGASAPEVTFHGTAAGNLPSILQHGFLRPDRVARAGKSVRVVNGSSFGVGVYSSKTADYSVSYCRGHCTMLVCATLLGGLGSGGHASGANGHAAPIAVHDNIVVAFDPRRIVPLFFLDFDMKSFDPRGTAAVTASPAAAAPHSVTPDELDRSLSKKAARGALVDPSRQRQFMRDLLRALHSRGVRDDRWTKHSQLQLQPEQPHDHLY